MSGAVFDAGALIAFEKGDRRVVAIVARALQRQARILIPAGVVGQVWRDGRRQVRLARLLGSNLVDVEPLGDTQARAAGQLCGATRTADVIDASVVLSARQRKLSVITSDPGDLRRLDPDIALIVV